MKFNTVKGGGADAAREGSPDIRVDIRLGQDFKDNLQDAGLEDLADELGIDLSAEDSRGLQGEIPSYDPAAEAERAWIMEQYYNNWK